MHRVFLFPFLCFVSECPDAQKWHTQSEPSTVKALSHHKAKKQLRDRSAVTQANVVIVSTQINVRFVRPAPQPYSQERGGGEARRSECRRSGWLLIVPDPSPAWLVAPVEWGRRGDRGRYYFLLKYMCGAPGDAMLWYSGRRWEERAYYVQERSGILRDVAGRGA
jgi:hypothetical protein